MNSPYLGDWAASAYTVGGRRIDYRVALNPDGTYEWAVRQGPDPDRAERGRWHHAEGDATLRLEPGTAEAIRSAWSVLSVTTCEDSNCLMVLRWVGLGSRNLPILFYRVHLPGRRSSDRLGST